MSDDRAWLQALSVEDRRRAEQILTTLDEWGCDDPRAWAESEISENRPQLARYRFLRAIWPEMIDSWRDGVGNIPAARRVVEAGGSPQDVARLARAVAYETAFALLARLAEEGRPGWALVETGPDGHPTGRHLDALHEDLLTLDTSGRDLWT
ncbi:hypothetical protein OWR29_01435 [Actinoplanes sp. Pm04-4]|uniref:Uncharacterized protein n=1 Tax=Paractinoplanes pyxinae TaxID=2997416 RepID=A0ABT4AQX3_9ACTN|nr:hypothetical protein [Actinoplanes pyxinae]MCY1136643.1 hypothetical protein [Actinoplanes pyxinae]